MSYFFVCALRGPALVVFNKGGERLGVFRSSGFITTPSRRRKHLLLWPRRITGSLVDLTLTQEEVCSPSLFTRHACHATLNVEERAAEMLYERPYKAEKGRRQRREKADERQEQSKRGSAMKKKLRQTWARRVEEVTHSCRSLSQKVEEILFTIYSL